MRTVIIFVSVIMGTREPSWKLAFLKRSNRTTSPKPLDREQPNSREAKFTLLSDCCLNPGGARLNRALQSFVCLRPGDLPGFSFSIVPRCFIALSGGEDFRIIHKVAYLTRIPRRSDSVGSDSILRQDSRATQERRNNSVFRTCAASSGGGKRTRNRIAAFDHVDTTYGTAQWIESSPTVYTATRIRAVRAVRGEKNWIPCTARNATSAR